MKLLVFLYFFAHAYFRVHCACGCGQKFVHSNRLVKTVLVEIASVLSTVRMIQIVGYSWQIPSFIFFLDYYIGNTKHKNTNVNKVSQDIICQKTPLCCYVGPQSKAKQSKAKAKRNQFKEQ